MAIYRTGKASLDANGIVTGYGTKWRKSLSLIRVGATIIFIDTPAYATIIDVVSDTELRVTDTAGAVVPESSYIILLHDSLSVDGLAQDVAETLRYYQGKENEFAHLIELINAMDIEAVQKVVDQMKEEVKKFEENFKQIEAKAAEVERNAQHVDLVKDEIEIIHTQTEDLKNQAHSSALQAQSHVNAAAAEVEKAAAEFHKAELEAARAGEEAVKAKAEVTRAQEIVAGAKEEVVTAAKEEVKRASAEADRAQGVVDQAKADIKAEVQIQVDQATDEANRAKSEADRAAQLADQMDTTKVMLKSNNLSDVEDKQAARRNLGVDNIVHDELETKIMTSSKQMWISLRNKGGSPWGVYDNYKKLWIALNPEQGGTGATTIDGARTNLKVDRLKQDVNMTRLFANDGKTELRIGQTEWYVYRTSNDSEHGYVPLGVDGGGTGGTTPEEARRGIGLERFIQDSDRTRMTTADGAKSFAITNGGAWGVYDNEGGWIPLTITSGGTGATTVQGAKENLSIERFFQPSNETIMFAPDKVQYFTVSNDSWGYYTGSGWKPLGVGQGGTGATDIASARSNLGLGSEQTVTFRNIDLNMPHTAPNSGILNLNIINDTVTGAQSQARVYHEVQAGVGKITFHVSANGKNRYIQIDENGGMTGLGSVYSEHLYTGGVSATGWISANQGNRVGLTTQVGGNKDIHISNISGDGVDGGWVNLLQGNWYNAWWQVGGKRAGDQRLSHLEMRVNNGAGAEGYYNFFPTGRMLASAGYNTSPLYNEPALRIGNKIDGEASCFVSGLINSGGWDQWRNRPCGMLCEMPAFDSAMNVFKVVHWGHDWVLGMDLVHWTNNTAEARINIKGASFNFNSAGTATAASWVSTSDIRLKANLKRIDSARGKVKELVGYTYYKRNNARSEDEYSNYNIEAGLIAQDVQNVLPEAVEKIGDTDMLGVNYSGVTALTVNAINEMGEVIDKQQEEIEALKGEVAELKSLIEKLISK